MTENRYIWSLASSTCNLSLLHDVMVESPPTFACKALAQAALAKKCITIKFSGSENFSKPSQN